MNEESEYRKTIERGRGKREREEKRRRIGRVGGGVPYLTIRPTARALIISQPLCDTISVINNTTAGARKGGMGDKEHRDNFRIRMSMMG